MAGVGGAGSCSSLTSSNSDETHGRVANRNTVMPNQQLPFGSTIGTHQKMGRNPAGGTLLHSLSTNDASVGEYKFTVNIGQHNIKITGDSLELVRVSVALNCAKCIGIPNYRNREFQSITDFQIGTG